MYDCKCGKSFERPSSLKSHGRFCTLYERKEKGNKYLTENGYQCECGRFFEKPQSLNSHFSRCLIHRKGEKPSDRKNGGGWSKGLTKESNQSLRIMAEKMKAKSRTWTDEQKEKLSESLKGKTGGYREGSNKWRGSYTKQTDGKEVWLDSSYEVRFVNLLDSFEIKWKKNYQKFPYSFEDKTKNYIPDFYLYDYDLWIEVKGWEKESDRCKWKDFPYLLKIIKNDLLKKMEIMKKEAFVAELVYAQD